MFEFLGYRVSDFMTRDPLTISPKATLADAQAVFDEHDFNALPVVDESGVLLGVVTKLDLLKAFRFTEQRMVPPYEDIMAAPVREVMTADAESVAPTQRLTRVLERMVATRCKSFPVVGAGRLVGVIAREDVLGAIRHAVAGGVAERLR